MNYWTLIGTLLGALIAGFSLLINSIYSSKSTQKREERTRLINEKQNAVKELETLYEQILHLLDKLIRSLGSLKSSDLECYYKTEIRLELISSNIINEQVKKISIGISNMAIELPKLPEEFIPKFEDDSDREYRLERRKKAKEKRKEKSKEYTPNLRENLRELSQLMKEDLQKRKLMTIEEYIKYQKKN